MFALLKCHYCPGEFRTVVQLMDHYRRGDCPNRSTLTNTGGFTCGNCLSQLSNVRSFTTHVHKYHKGAVPPSPSSPACRHTPDRTPVLRSLEDERTPVKANAPPPPPLPPSAVPSVKTMSDEAACAYMCTIGSTFIADFHRNTAATNKSIQQAVVFTRKTMEEMAGVLDHLHDDYVTRKCGGENCDHMKEFVALAQQVMTNWMKPLSTVHKRWNYFVESGALIPPEIVTLNTRKVVCGDEVPELIKDMSGQYVSITKTLKNVLELPGLLDEINDYKAYCEDQTGIFNICQGSAWLNGVSNAPDCLTLPVNIYFDDFETGNPLGSHSGGANKLGAVYMTLPFLPPRLQSKLDFIFLVMIFSSMDRREKGQDADNYRIFKWVILELNELGRVGIELNLPGRKTVIKFALGCLVGDNLGLNDILGFTTSFSAIRCCRLCRATKNQFSQLTVEDESLMRNSVNYQQDYEKWEKGETDTGIVGDNVWEKLDNFSIDNKVSVDLMHDMYEGVARYTMQVVLKGLIAKNSRFTLEYLNSRIKNLRYGPDRYSKPTQIGPSKKRGGNFNIRMSASEMRNFVAYFGLLVGHKVDPYDPDYRTPTAPPPAKKRRLKEKDDDSSSYFHLYNLMCAILRIITSDRVVDEEVRRLQLLIKDFLMLYMKLSNRLTSLVAHSSGVHVTEDGDGDDSDSEFLEGKLQPKFHLLTHYPSIMLKLGPLAPLSSMRPEGKHKIVKKALTSISNSINPPLSAARKVQLSNMSLIMRNELPSALPTVSKMVVIEDIKDHSLKCTVSESENKLRAHFSIEPNVQIRYIKFVVTSQDVRFAINDTVCLDVTDDGYPRFGEILNLFCTALDNTVVYVETLNLQTLYFCEHFGAYRIGYTHTTCFHNFNEITALYPFPNNLVESVGKGVYVLSRNPGI